MNKVIYVTLVMIHIITQGNCRVHAQLNNQIYILPTLHQLHQQVSNYSFEDLKSELEKLEPDVLIVELTESDLETRKHQKNKIKYNEVVFPFTDKHKIPMFAMEPSDLQPVFRHIIIKPHSSPVC